MSSRAVCGQMPVPHIEGVQRASVTPESRAGRGLQQRRPLSEHFLVVGPDRRHPRPADRGQIVEVTPPIPRVATDQRQILGREQHRAQHTE